MVALLLLIGPSGARVLAQSPSQIENSRRANRSWVNLTRRILGYRARYDYFQASAGAVQTPQFK